MPHIASACRRLMTVAVMTLLASGCLSHQRPETSRLHNASGDSMASVAVEIDYPVIGPDGRELQVENMRHSEKASLLALKALLDGHDGEDLEVPLAVRGPDHFPNELGSLDAFQVKKVTLKDVSGRVRSSDQVHTAGTMFLSDPTGRRLRLKFSTQGERQGGVIDLSQAQALPVMPENFESEAFVLPGSRMNREMARDSRSYTAFYHQVQRLALTESEVHQLPRGRENYLIVVFLKNPLLDPASLEVRLSGPQQNLAGGAVESHYKRFPGGWTVALIQKDLDLRQTRGQWVKVIYRAPAQEGSQRGQFHLTANHPLTRSNQNVAKIRIPVH